MILAQVDTATIYVPALIAAAVSIGGILVNRWFSKRQDTADAEKKEAEAEKIKADTAMILIQPLKDSIAELREELEDVKTHAKEQAMADEERIEELTERVEAVERWAHLLFTQVLEAGVTPFTFEESEHLRNTGS